MMELIRNIAIEHSGYAVFAASASRTREGNDFYHEMKGRRRARQGGAGLRPDERAARQDRSCVALTGLTISPRTSRDEGRDVLLFIDNIYRCTLAGVEVSALLGRMPSAVGYQPTLAWEMGILQERITSTKTGSITSVQAIYVPADDLTDPSPATTFAHLDATVVLSRPGGRTQHLPGRGPARLDLTPGGPARDRRGALPHHARRAGDAATLQGIAGHHRHPRHGRDSEDDRLTVSRARKIQRFLSQPFFVAEVFTGVAGKYVSLKGHHPRFPRHRRWRVRFAAGAGVLHGRLD